LSARKYIVSYRIVYIGAR